MTEIILTDKKTNATKDRELVDNVWSFLNKTAERCGNMERDRFNDEMHANCLELGMQSPIEDMFWIACQAMCKAAYIEVNPDPWFNQDGSMRSGCGVYIQPQRRIGSYRVDFALSQSGIGPSDILSPIIVELDGHDFHDKDKHQRAKEKARDRFLVKEGFRVLHFTGSDVVADPYKIAFEVLEMLGLTAVNGIESYNPKDPLGLGE